MATALAYAARWNLAVFGLIPLLSSVIAAIIGLLGFLMLWRARPQASPGLHLRSSGLLLASLFLFLQLASIPIAKTLRDWEVQRAQAFIHSLIPSLEEYKRQHHTYPANLNSILTSADAPPPLLRLTGTFPFAYDNRQFYLDRETTYGFQFYVPDGFIGFQYSYCCGATGAWTVAD